MRVIESHAIDLSDYMGDRHESHKIRPASDWAEDVIDGLYKPRNTPRIELGWAKTRGKFEFRPGEVTIWAGVNGHGKSLLSGQVALDLCAQDQKVCIASLEMKPAKTMMRFAKQARGDGMPEIEYVRQLHSWTDGRLWLYDHTGSVKPETILAVVRYAVAEHGVEHFFIDNLMKCVPGEDDYNAQKDFVNSLTAIAQETNAHIHLVAHVKKAGSEYERPGKFDIKGTGAITDLADNVFIVYRNKKKEAVANGKLAMKGIEADTVMAEPDCWLSIEKQRNGDFEGVFGFWFDMGSMQYIENRGERPKRYNVEPQGVQLARRA